MNIKPLSNGTKIIFDDDQQYAGILAMMDNQLRGKNKQLDSVLEAASEAMQAGYIPNDETEKTNPKDKYDLGKPATIIPNNSCSNFIALFLQTISMLENGDDSSEYQHRLDEVESKNYNLRKENEKLNRKAAELEGRIQNSSELDSIVNSLQAKNTALQEQLNKAVEAKNATETSLTNLKNENVQLQSQIESMTNDSSKAEELQKQIKDYETKLTSLNAAYGFEKMNNGNLASENEELKKKIDEYSKDASGVIPTEITDLRNENEELKKRLEEAKNQQVVLENENKQLKNKPVDESLYINKEDYQALVEQLNEVTTEKAKLDDKNLSDANEIQKLKSENEMLKSSAGNSTELTKQVSELTNERDQLKRELRTARDDAERFRQAAVNGPSQSDFDNLRKENELIKLKFAQVWQEKESLKKKKGIFGL